MSARSPACSPRPCSSARCSPRIHFSRFLYAIQYGSYCRMEQNHIQPPEARADEQASPSTPASEGAQPAFTTMAAQEACWNGVNDGIRAVSPPRSEERRVGKE